jgi:predicted O-methyltransferase YrrM
MSAKIKKAIMELLKLLPYFLSLPKKFYSNYKSQASPGAYKDNFTRWLFLLFRGKIHLIYKAYFNKTLDWKKLDNKAIVELDNTMPFSREGCLLDKVNDLRVRAQVNFISALIHQNNAKKILETGTHKAMFCYVAYLCNSAVTIDTFGNLKESQKAVNILNHKFGEYIRYHLGDTRKTLKDFSPEYQIDFAWVDGGHSLEVCYSDLKNCHRLNIPSIVVDDYKWSGNVKKSVNKFTKEYNYSVQGISNLLDYRGIVHLTRIDK